MSVWVFLSLLSRWIEFPDTYFKIEVKIKSGVMIMDKNKNSNEPDFKINMTDEDFEK